MLTIILLLSLLTVDDGPGIDPDRGQQTSVDAGSSMDPNGLDSGWGIDPNG